MRCSPNSFSLIPSLLENLLEEVKDMLTFPRLRQVEGHRGGVLVQGLKLTQRGAKITRSASLWPLGGWFLLERTGWSPRPRG